MAKQFTYRIDKSRGNSRGKGEDPVEKLQTIDQASSVNKVIGKNYSTTDNTIQELLSQAISADQTQQVEVRFKVSSETFHGAGYVAGLAYIDSSVGYAYLTDISYYEHAQETAQDVDENDISFRANREGGTYWFGDYIADSDGNPTSEKAYQQSPIRFRADGTNLVIELAGHETEAQSWTIDRITVQ